MRSLTSAYARRAVAVEMIGLEVEEDADHGIEGFDVLELKRRELTDDPRGGVDCADERRQRAAHVARDLDRAIGRAKDLAEQLAGRRLAVRPGYAEDGVREELRAQLDLAPDGNTAPARAGDEQCLTRDTRALHDEIDPL
jgi:hypothetical protein